MAVLGRARATALWVTVIVMMPVWCARVAGQPASEQDVKAAFLFNFTKFVTWPSGAPRAGEPFRVCVVADVASRRAVERMVSGESVNGRPLEAVVPKGPEQIRLCQILFVGASAAERAGPLLRAARDLPVLTVSDSDRIGLRGAAIVFVLDGGRMRFDVNPANARGLTISSRLLRIARDVRELSE